MRRFLQSVPYREFTLRFVNVPPAPFLPERPFEALLSLFSFILIPDALFPDLSFQERPSLPF